MKRKFDDVYELGPIRFEELVADVFRRLGYLASMTPRSYDEGVDIYRFHGPGGRPAIVQCKRFKEHRTVGVTAVRELLVV